MIRYIDFDAARKAVRHEVNGKPDECIRMLRALDRQPVLTFRSTAYWHRDSTAHYYCGECGTEQSEAETVSRYCPYCGAYMKNFQEEKMRIEQKN